ncbi:MAG: DUF4251 domain-containing protein [Bacteroides sp.]|nr:DUF4251 domain-containing protein [Bacteroides sp.]
MKRFVISIFSAIAVSAIMLTVSSCRTGMSSAEVSYADSVANNVAKLQLKHRKFVMTADRITINNSPLLNVTDDTNFLLVDSIKGIIQISPRNFGGINNVGGITISGDVSSYKMEEDSHGNLTVTYRVSAPIGSSEVRIELYKGGNRAQATVNATFNRGRATLNGEIKALGANYFEGRSF